MLATIHTSEPLASACSLARLPIEDATAEGIKHDLERGLYSFGSMRTRERAAELLPMWSNISDCHELALVPRIKHDLVIL